MLLGQFLGFCVHQVKFVLFEPGSMAILERNDS